MSLAGQIQADLQAALKSGQTLRLSVLRQLSSEINYKHIELQRDLTDQDVVGVVQKEAKKRREAVSSFEQAGRTESAHKEQQEAEILAEYLPQMLGSAEIAQELAGSDEIRGLADFGQVMKIVAPKFKGRAEGATVARVVQEHLAKG